jgi:uncharacterized phage protein (TIGR02218 family)
VKSVSSDTLDILASRQFAVADLYMFSLPSGINLYYTSADIDITVNGHTYKCGGTTGPYIDRSAKSGGQKALCHWKPGLEVGTLQFDIIPGSAQVNGTAFLTACRIGLFDGADFSLDRYVSNATKSGTIPMFQGRVAEIDAGRSFATFQIADHRELLNQVLPKNLFQSSCRWSFCSSGCTLNRADFPVTSTAASGSTGSLINATLAAATGAYDQGSITFTGGPNNGLTRTVKTYTNGSPSTVTMTAPFPYAPGIGDTFSILQGCSRTTTACAAYGKLANLGGTPFVPAAATAS